MKKASLQYTIRGISKRTDMVLREAAARHGTSLNDEAVRALEAGLGISGEPVVYHDLDDLIGTWVKDPGFDKAIASMDRIDEELWK